MEFTNTAFDNCLSSAALSRYTQSESLVADAAFAGGRRRASIGVISHVGLLGEVDQCKPCQEGSANIDGLAGVPDPVPSLPTRCLGQTSLRALRQGWATPWCNHFQVPAVLSPMFSKHYAPLLPLPSNVHRRA
jgi:hypothetical protein